jgi:hypothetical protein
LLLWKAGPKALLRSLPRIEAAAGNALARTTEITTADQLALIRGVRVVVMFFFPFKERF